MTDIDDLLKRLRTAAEAIEQLRREVQSLRDENTKLWAVVGEALKTATADLAALRASERKGDRR